MLVRPWSGKKQTKGGIILSDETNDKIAMTTVVGLVVNMGDLCYKDKDKFPTGPWVKEGQFVLYVSYSGSRFQTKLGDHGRRLREMVRVRVKWLGHSGEAEG